MGWRRGGRTRRAGRRTLHDLRGEALSRARKSWQQLGLFLILWSAAATVLVAIQNSTFMRGFVAGLMLGLLGFFLMVFLVAAGIATRQMGGAAEQWTAQVLEHLDRRLWYVAHDVPFDSFNVDHVLVGPGRIYAIETKWTAWHDDPRFRDAAVKQAERASRKLRLLLHSLDLQREVIPLVVVWGPGTSEMSADPTWLGGVGIVAGAHANVWLSKLQMSGQGVARDLEAQKAVARFIVLRDQYQGAS